jgi:hypothetical protein
VVLLAKQTGDSGDLQTSEVKALMENGLEFRVGTETTLDLQGGDLVYSVYLAAG